MRLILTLTVLLAACLRPVGVPALAETPKRGGTLNFAVVAEPPTTDCHATTTFGMVHPVAPQYSTLLMFTGPHDNLKIEGDLAEILGGLQGRPHLHLQAKEGRQVPRRFRLHI